MSSITSPADRGGDHSAQICQALYERHAQRLLRYCLFQLDGQRQEAEDALQVTFLHALRALQRGERPRSEGAWLCRIARNVCLSRRRELRRSRRIETVDPQVLMETVAAEETESVDVAQLRESLAGLSASQREALLLREWQGLSYREIAERMNRSVANVESLLFRARRALSDALKDEPRRRRAAGLAGGLGIVDLLRHWKAVSASLVAPKAVGAGVVAGALAVAGTYGLNQAIQDQPPTGPAAVAALEPSARTEGSAPPAVSRSHREQSSSEAAPAPRESEPPASLSTVEAVAVAGTAQAPRPAVTEPASERSGSGTPPAGSGPEPTDPLLAQRDLDETVPDLLASVAQLAAGAVEESLGRLDDTVKQAAETVGETASALVPVQPVADAVAAANEIVEAVPGVLP